MAKKTIATQLKVGIFVAVGLALLMTVIFMIGGERRFFSSTYTLYANFTSISGLRVGAPVQLAGLKVGYVDGIRFPDDPAIKKITVVLKIRSEYQQHIRQDSEATIETQGLLGDKYIYVSMGSDVQPVIPNKGVITAEETVSFFALGEKAGRIMDDIGEAAEALKDLLTSVKGKEGAGDLRASIASIRRMLEQVEKGKGLIHALIYDPNGERVVDALADTMDNIRDLVATAEEESQGELGGLIVNMRHASDDLRKILGAVRRGEGTLGRFIYDPSVYEQLKSLLGRANRSKLMRAVIRSTLEQQDQQVLK